jgi:hypothetical protein
VKVLAACHLHSSWSYDGSWSLDALVSAFGTRRYRVLMMTEHDRGFNDTRYAEFRAACACATSESVYVLPGIEYSDPENRVHVLVWGAIPFLGEGLRTETLLEAVDRHGGIAVLAHPARRNAWECVRPEWSSLLLGVEVWNRKYDGWSAGVKGTSIAASANSMAFVGLDFHTERQLFPLGMNLTIDGAIDEQAILACLRRRQCAPTAFGLGLDEVLFRQAHPVLKVAENGRRHLARLKRYAKAGLSW